MDGGIAAIIAGLVGVVGALGGTLVGGRAAVAAASVASESNQELSRQEARRQAYAALGTAAFLFSRKAVDIQQILDERWVGSKPTYVPVPAEEYSALDARLDEVAHTAIGVQLHGPTELVDLAWDVYVAYGRVKRALADYGVVGRPGLEKVKRALENAYSEALAARRLGLVLRHYNLLFCGLHSAKSDGYASLCVPHGQT
jgi:hypothetical protein